MEASGCSDGFQQLGTGQGPGKAKESKVLRYWNEKRIWSAENLSRLSCDSDLNLSKHLWGDLKILANDPQPTWQSWRVSPERTSEYLQVLRSGACTARGALALGRNTNVNAGSFLRICYINQQRQKKRKRLRNVHFICVQKILVSAAVLIIYSKRHTMCPQMCQAPFPTSPYHLLKEKGIVGLNGRWKQGCSLAFCRNVAALACIVPSKYISKSCFTGMMLFFNTKITAAVPARVFRLSFASRLKLEQQWNIGFIRSIKQKYPFIQNSHVLPVNFEIFLLDDDRC